jgi:hypothetical protein
MASGRLRGNLDRIVGLLAAPATVAVATLAGMPRTTRSRSNGNISPTGILPPSDINLHRL